MVEGEGSSVMGASQKEDWGDEVDEEIDLEKSSVAGSISGRRSAHLLPYCRLVSSLSTSTANSSPG